MFVIRCESSKQNGKKAILSVLSIIKKKKKVQNPVLFKV